MAESTQVECTDKEGERYDDLTSCPICFEKFTKPKYLPCLHTFCEACLHTYITKEAERDSRPTGFKCPICRTLVPAPGSPGTPSEWASLIPVNHFINTLMERDSLKRGETFCHACLWENESETATSWCNECMEALCENCSKCHRRQSATRSHQLVPIDKASPGNIPVQSDLINCKEHADKRIEFYCTDHEIPCCISCVTLKHRKCEAVDTMASAAKSFCKTATTEELLRELGQKHEEMEQFIREQSKNIQSLEKDASRISSKMSNQVTEVVQKITKLKEDGLEEIVKIKKLKTEEIENTKEEMKMSSSLLQNYRSLLAMAKMHGSEEHLFLEFKRIQSLFSEWKQRQAKKLPKTHAFALSFDTDETFTRLTSSLTTLGKLQTLTLEPDTDVSGIPVKGTSTERGPKIDFMTATPTLIREFQAPLGARVSGAVFLNDDRLLIADRTNPRCIMIDDNGKLLQEIRLSNLPFGLDYLQEREVIISFENKTQVQRLQTDSMTLRSTIDLTYPCRAISIRQGVVYASSERHIHKFDTKGMDLIITDCANSYCVAARDEDTILYANLNGHTVICISDKGDEKFRYNHNKLCGSFAIDLDCQGNAYVLGASSTNLHQISPTGKKSRILLEGSVGNSYPNCVKFKPNSNIFLATYLNGTKIKIYEMK